MYTADQGLLQLTQQADEKRPDMYATGKQNDTQFLVQRDFTSIVKSQINTSNKLVFPRVDNTASGILWGKKVEEEDGKTILTEPSAADSYPFTAVYVDQYSRFSTSLARNQRQTQKLAGKAPKTVNFNGKLVDIRNGAAFDTPTELAERAEHGPQYMASILSAGENVGKPGTGGPSTSTQWNAYNRLCIPIPTEVPPTYDYEKLLPIQLHTPTAGEANPTLLDVIARLIPDGRSIQQSKIMLVATLRTNAVEYVRPTAQSLDFLDKLNTRSSRITALIRHTLKHAATLRQEQGAPAKEEGPTFLYLDTPEAGERPHESVLAKVTIAETKPEILTLYDDEAEEARWGEDYHAWIKKKSPQMAQYALDQLWQDGPESEQYRRSLAHLGSASVQGGAAPPLLVLPYDTDLAPVVRTLPTTHELGGHLLTGGGGQLARIVTFEGDACRDAAGRRLTATRQCKIRKPDAAISFHTHPKSNRPSSADLRNAVLKHPALHRRRTPGKRLLSLVVTPDGVWTYAPKPHLLARWRRLRARDIQATMTEWSRHGRQRTPAALVAYMQEQGMELAYFPHAALRGKTLRVEASGRARADPA